LNEEPNGERGEREREQGEERGKMENRKDLIC
jgi:hypothetical protein